MNLSAMLERRGQRSDPHGAIDHHPMDAFAAEAVDPRDRALTGVSRNTVTKHLAANTIEPKFVTPERPSKTDPFADKLTGWLKTDAGN